MNNVSELSYKTLIPEKLSQSPIKYYMNDDNLVYDVPNSRIFCNDKREVNSNIPETINQNTFFKTAPNPRTLIPPVITPPSHDIGYWKANNLITHSAVNTQKQIDDYNSGYLASTNCNSNNDLVQKSFYRANNMPRSYGKNKNSYTNSFPENYIPPSCYKGGHNYFQDLKEMNNIDINDASGGSSSSIRFVGKRAEDIHDGKPIPNSIEGFVNPRNSEVFTEPHMEGFKFPYEIFPKKDGDLNESCGYDPEQLIDGGLPSNFPSGKCQRDPLFKEYNENMFTEVIQPGVYTQTQIDEPINSNIGISFQQQFPPTVVQVDNKNGDIMYTKEDPRLFNPELLKSKDPVEGINTANVFDPRFNGYGTDYRSYTDKLLGQPKFFYDDINSVRMPNYIVRSNIDAFPWADSYGPMSDSSGNENNYHIRDLANQEFLDSAIEFRTGLQERLMRKTNAEGWQQRLKPIRTGGQRMMGGMRI